MNFILLKLTLLSVLSILAAANASEPYCTRNETTITRKPVSKTRLVVKKPTGAFKWFKKTKYTTEYYQADEVVEHVKTVHGCCDGYKMINETRICEPICEQGCPEKATCVRPNVCQCGDGFISGINSFDGSHYCEPICKQICPDNARCIEPDVCACEPGYHKLDLKCEPRCSSGCPFGGECILPEQCKCADGYSAESGTCLPICSAGDGCQHGKCEAPEKCVCHKGYYMDEKTQLCEQQNCDSDAEGDCNFGTDEPETTATTEHQQQQQFNEDDRIFVISANTEFAEGVTPIQCPENFFFYNNVCRPKQFASNEFDCRFQPCMENAFCQANGTCACKEGFIWYKKQSTKYSDLETEDDDDDESSTTETMETTTEIVVTASEPAACLTPTQIQAVLAGTRQIDDDEDGSMDWMSVGVITLAVLCVLGASCLIFFKVIRRRKQALDVEAKNDLMCAYDNKNPKVY